VGYLLLEGGAEFGRRMADPDRRAIELAGSMQAPIRILPTAAAPDNNHVRAGNNGVRWFQSLGATDVSSLALIDQASAQDEKIAQALRAARLIYLLGGFPGYLGRTLKLSPAWEAATQAYRAGAVIAGSSAGAMVLCEFYFDREAGQVLDGLNLVRNTCVLPHHNTFGKGWARDLAARLPGVTLLGIDEQVGVVDDGSADRWTVFGGGSATLYRGETVKSYGAGETFAL